MLPKLSQKPPVFCIFVHLYFCIFVFFLLDLVQSGASSLAKQGGAYFSAVCGSIQDPIAAPGPYGNQEP